MYKILIKPENQIEKGYMNSNLGIPRYLKIEAVGPKLYYLLGDEEKRVKLYNAN